MSAADPDQIVRDFSAAWGRADLEFIMDCFAEDAVYHNMPMQPAEGKATIRAFIEGFLKTSPGGIDFEIVNQVAAGNLVMNERVDTFENDVRFKASRHTQRVKEVRDIGGGGGEEPVLAEL